MEQSDKLRNVSVADSDSDEEKPEVEQPWWLRPPSPSTPAAEPKPKAKPRTRGTPKMKNSVAKDEPQKWWHVTDSKLQEIVNGLAEESNPEGGSDAKDESESKDTQKIGSDGSTVKSVHFKLEKQASLPQLSRPLRPETAPDTQATGQTGNSLNRSMTTGRLGTKTDSGKNGRAASAPEKVQQKPDMVFQHNPNLFAKVGSGMDGKKNPTIYTPFNEMPIFRDKAYGGVSDIRSLPSFAGAGSRRRWGGA
eukprot:TRINITY_DN12349_c1_g5_i1.p1 TRINITY_DN12349_c1_g5~~TRINITY_DN12349_c1_g5_i1.p1  ORF type:complete len:250 (+),score=57.88 TRINITY_DN12349_c1_g5_i1:102-851(+)